jgi:hypothetical protein
MVLYHNIPQSMVPIHLCMLVVYLEVGSILHSNGHYLSTRCLSQFAIHCLSLIPHSCSTKSKLIRSYRTLECFLANRPARSTASLSNVASHHQTVPTAIQSINLLHLCPHGTFDLIIEYCLEFIYPLTPIIHRPLFL